MVEAHFYNFVFFVDAKMIERANYTITKITITTIIVIKVELLYFHMMITDPWTGSVS